MPFLPQFGPVLPVFVPFVVNIRPEFGMAARSRSVEFGQPEHTAGFRRVNLAWECLKS